MKNLLHVPIALIIAGSFTGCQPQNAGDSGTHQSYTITSIDSLISNHHENDLFHGGIVITQHGQKIFEKYIGVADRTWNISVGPDVKFDIASVNKSMISALILKAVEDGRLNLDDQLVDLVSGFDYDGSFDPGITLHHLMSHTSGLPDYDAVDEELKSDNFTRFKRMRFTNEEYVNFISKLKPINRPGKQFYYSNFAYHLLTIILEETYQKPFSQVLEENLIQPLGLKNTVSESRNEIIIEKLAGAYTFDHAEDQWLESPFIDLSLGRRIFSTASDLNRWAQVMDNPGYLTKHSLRLMRQNHLAGISENVSHGYGWFVFDEEKHSKIGDLGISRPYIIHGGSTDGYKSMLINVDRGAYVISFLSNVGNRTNEMDLAMEIVKILLK